MNSVRCHRVSLVGLFLLVVLLGAGCTATTDSGRKTGQVPAGIPAANYLSTDMLELTLPEGWFLTIPTEEEDVKLSLFNLMRMDKLGSGWIGRVPMAQGSEYEWTAKTWLDSLKGFNSNIRSEKVTLDGRKATLTSSTTKNGYEQRDAVILDVNCIYVVSMIMDPGYLAGNHSAPDSVFRTIRSVSPGRSLRRIPGIPVFSCLDGAFAWYSDLDSAPGWVAFNNRGGIVIAISIVATFAESIEQHAEGVGDNPFTLGFFNARFPIGSEWVDARGSGFVSDGSYYLVYLFRHGGQNYLLNLVTTPDVTDVDFKNIHSLPETRDYLKKYVSF